MEELDLLNLLSLILQIQNIKQENEIYAELKAEIDMLNKKLDILLSKLD